MTAWILVESMFGNSRTIADRIAEGIAETMPAVVHEISEAPTEIPADVSLLVVGGPTHAFSMTRRATREDALKRGATASVKRGVREWLDRLSCADPHLAAASFDTRVHQPFVPGSAARAITRRLLKEGATVIAAPISFHVADVQGPLLDGEEERAIAFGRQLASDLARRGLWRQAG